MKERASLMSTEVKVDDVGGEIGSRIGMGFWNLGCFCQDATRRRQFFWEGQTDSGTSTQIHKDCFFYLRYD